MRAVGGTLRLSASDLEPECRTPRQILLANAFCRYFELAREVGLDALARAARLGPQSSRSGPIR